MIPFHSYNSSLNTDLLGILVVYFIVFKWILKACLFRAKNLTTTPGNPCLPASPYVPYTHKHSFSNTCITNVNTVLDQVLSQMGTHQSLVSVKRLFLHLLLSSFEQSSMSSFKFYSNDCISLKSRCYLRAKICPLHILNTPHSLSEPFKTSTSFLLPFCQVILWYQRMW